MTGTHGTDGTLRHIAVVGASRAGIRAAEALRLRGYDGRLTLVDAGSGFPPGTGEPGPDDPAPGRTSTPGPDVEPLPNSTAVGLDLTDATRRRVRLSGRRILDVDGLVIATGAAARRPHALRGGHPAVYALRTFEERLTADDGPALDAALGRNPRVAVIGAGFTGCEIAADCRARGLDVTLVEARTAPMERLLGTAMGRELAALHRDHGTVLATGSPAVSLRPDGVLLADGTLVPADVVVLAAGRVPRTEWLLGSGLDVTDGVLLDATCAAERTSRVVAAGSVARWCNPMFGEVMRAEHRSDKDRQAVAAADTLLADGEDAMPFESLPYVRSEQYGAEIQFAGLAIGGPHIVAGTLVERRFVALYTDGQHITGVLCVNAPSQLDRYWRMVAARVPKDQVLAPPTTLKSVLPQVA
ncbi:FAD-dependent oxidoreductase [Streptomyces sp. NBC_01498]|uniref:NAD(P)/FAD-dependent oxidoreductase n=1 Tax=Streptomyces sp. NBC_01498 TaxID=2975870 RepID=UPI002E7AB35D|nr:FAD-dependent oxidoreductase [Streptomyces sp. NBC_01498]WTL26403.1 FAD-dependent oxidoreductase [Streptomyces sp. NBC_01498]